MTARALVIAALLLGIAANVASCATTVNPGDKVAGTRMGK